MDAASALISVAVAKALGATSSEGDSNRLATLRLAWPVLPADVPATSAWRERPAEERSPVLANWSRLVDQIGARAPYWISQPEATLSRCYHQVLSRAEVARIPLTPEQERRRVEAEQGLFDTDEHGVRLPNPRFQIFLEHEQKVIETREKLAAARHEGATELASAVAVQLATAERNWSIFGHRDDVGSTLALLTSLERQQHPVVRWDEERFRLEELVPREDPRTATSYLPVDTSPSGLDVVEWHAHVSSERDIDRLAQEAEHRFGNRIASRIAEQGLQEMRFEMALVTIGRPWLNLELIRSRSWRWRDGDQPPLSDGEGGGLVPAFIAKLVLARNISVVFRRTAVAGEVSESLAGEALEEISSLHEQDGPRQVGSVAKFGPLLLRPPVGQGGINNFGSWRSSPERVRLFQAMEVAEAQPGSRTAHEQMPRLLTKHADLQRAFLKVKRVEPPRHLGQVLSAAGGAGRDRPEPRPTVVVKPPTIRVDPMGGGTIRDHRENRLRFAGRVVAANGRHVAGAQVLFDERDSDRHRTVTTGSDGRFEVTLPKGRYDIIGSAEGFLSKIIEDAKAATDFTVQLQPDTTQNNVEVWQIIAVIRHQLPHLPDPDPSLDWSDL